LYANGDSLTCGHEALSQRAHIVQPWRNTCQETASGIRFDEEVRMVRRRRLPIESNISPRDDSPRWIRDCARKLGRLCQLSRRKDRTSEQCRK
jgi:hypothetical protein